MAYENKEFDPKAAAEARKAEMEEMMKKLENGVKDIFTTEGYRDYLNFCAKLPRYSVNNQILIMLQRPDATMCQSFTGWKDMNRFVKKGEKGIRIMAPAPYKMQKEQDKVDNAGNPILDKDGEHVKETVEITVNAFKPVSTFDISQTEGEPIPTIGTAELTGTVEGYNALFEAIKEVVPVPITFENIPSGAKGYFHLEENRIAIQEGMSEAQTVKTAIHEAAHQILHSREAKYGIGADKSKNQKETEAESVAYVVCQHYGIDTSDYSFAYVATWSQDKDVPELKASLDTIRRTASEMIMKIDEKLQAREEVKETDQSKEADQTKETGFGEATDQTKGSGQITEPVDELPFVDPEADLPFGFIKIEPPVDFSNDPMARPIKLSIGPFPEEKESEQETEPNGSKDTEKVTGKSEKKLQKDSKKTRKDNEKKSAKKPSIMDKIKAGKEKTDETKNMKKDPKKDLQEAI